MNKKFSVIKRIMIVIPSLILAAAIIMSYLYLSKNQFRIVQICLIILGFIAFYFGKKLDKKDKEKQERDSSQRESKGSAPDRLLKNSSKKQFTSKHRHDKL